MAEELTIGRVAALTGLTSKTIRFYEEGGYVPRPGRRPSGYRTYTTADVRRLKLVKLARLLGLPLAEVKPLVERAFAIDCSDLAGELTGVLDRQQSLIAQRIEELRALSAELDDLKGHIEHCECEPGRTLANCELCAILG
jgi:MerR family copper efflux transcriptional regulator